MKKLFISILFCFAVIPVFAQSVTPNQALKFLADGNKRFVSESCTNQGRDMHTIKELTHGQHPYAVVVSCSDSRVPPELLFDEGFGKLFVIRVAGNIVGPHELGSIEYAVKKLGTQLILVLGHTECGAVHAAIEAQDYGPNINSIVSEIAPSVLKAKEKHGGLMENAVIENVMAVKHNIETNPGFENLLAESKLKVVPAVYNIETGEVTFHED